MDDYITRPEYNERMQRVDDENNRQNHRIDKLEGAFDKLSELATSVKLLAQNMSDMKTELQRQGKRLEEIEQEPADKWKKLTWLIITGVAGAALGFILSKLGL